MNMNAPQQSPTERKREIHIERLHSPNDKFRMVEKKAEENGEDKVTPYLSFAGALEYVIEIYHGEGYRKEDVRQENSLSGNGVAFWITSDAQPVLKPSYAAMSLPEVIALLTKQQTCASEAGGASQTLEPELTQRIVELLSQQEEMQRRYSWAANELLACDYGDNDTKGEQSGWYVYGWRDREVFQKPHHEKRRIYGKSIDEAISNQLNKVHAATLMNYMYRSAKCDLTLAQLKVLFKWRLGINGPKCANCGFHEASHIDKSLEWNIDDWACDNFKPIERK